MTSSSQHGASVPRLFKYRPITKHTSDIFCRGVLWFSRPDAFNDPCDCLPIIDLNIDEAGFRAHLLEGWRDDYPTWTQEELHAAVERAVADHYPLDAVRKAKFESDYRRRIFSCGVFSASERFDSVVMWSHYADQHRGICLELDPRTLPENVLFHKVKYQDERPAVNLFRDRKTANRVSAGTKSTEWQYEREWRIAVEPHGAAEFPCEITVPPKMLLGVILGTRISANDRARVLDWCRALPEHPSVYEASIDEQLFRVNRALISY